MSGLGAELLAGDHRRPPPYPFEHRVSAGGCAFCGKQRPKGRRRYCGERCGELADVPWRNSYALYIIGRDRFGDDPPRCANCGMTEAEAAAAHGLARGEAIWRPLEVDHRRPLYSLDDAERLDLRWWLPENLDLLCHWCHVAKSAREARDRAREKRDARDGSALVRGEVEPLTTPGVGSSPLGAAPRVTSL